MDKQVIKDMCKAINMDDLDFIKELIKNNEGILKSEIFFGTWLHIAASEGKLNLVKYFIECGLDVNKDRESGGNALTSAAEEGHLEIVDLLFKSGAKLNISDAVRNPLFGAIQNNHLDVVHYLVEHGIDISVKYNIGTLENVDAYEYARQYGKTEIANYLKECKNNR